MARLVHELLLGSARRTPEARAVSYRGVRHSYQETAFLVERCASAFIGLGIGRSERIAVYLEKRMETVVAIFGAAAAGAVFVPVNPLLKSDQVAHILGDCDVRVLVTTLARYRSLAQVLERCQALRQVIIVGGCEVPGSEEVEHLRDIEIVVWDDFLNQSSGCSGHRAIDTDMAAILYTSGSTGKPKGVVLSHRNLVVGAESVSEYLKNDAEDRILSVLPLSFDYGLSQLTTAFHAGAEVVLMNYLFPRDVVDAVLADGITGLAAVPALWAQLAQAPWPSETSLRYITNSGGAMPLSVLNALQKALPRTRIYLMYGLTEAFRSTYLPPEQLAGRPNSIGRAIPNAEVLVLRPDGSQCAPGEPGELVHRGSLVALGYWNNAVATAQRFRRLPKLEQGMPNEEVAVWSGDTVRADEEGYLYFVGRTDEQIKVSGYRISPSEIEEVLGHITTVDEAVAVGVSNNGIESIFVFVYSKAGTVTAPHILDECRKRLPAYMVPAEIRLMGDHLPRNPNGKFDRVRLKQSLLKELEHPLKELEHPNHE
jgi:acyl-CoA ligase (AMP-forming) (exosortase A-associated)